VTHVFPGHIAAYSTIACQKMDVPVSSGGGQDYEMNISDDDKILKPYGEIFGMNFLSR
jgi:hypothetical protein